MRAHMTPFVGEQLLPRKRGSRAMQHREHDATRTSRRNSLPHLAYVDFCFLVAGMGVSLLSFVFDSN